MSEPGADDKACPHESIRDAFEKAESFIKLVEAVDGEVVIPAINELRYAGFHLTRLLVASSEEERARECHSILSHCRRASYEALDAGLIFLLEKVQLFKDDYRQIVITDVLSDYPDILAYADEVNELLAQPREEGEIRDGDFQVRVEAFNRLKKMVRKLDKAREELNKKMEENNEQIKILNEKIRKERRNFILAVLTLAITLLGVAVSLLK